MDFSAQLRLLLDIVIALGMGGILGMEREYQDKPAGLRTHMLICGSAALLTMLGMLLVNEMELSVSDQALGVDPTRIVHAIIVGVSFIGGGTILKSKQKDHVLFLTTAASLLLASGIGIAVGLQLYPLAIGATLLGLVVNALIRRLFPSSLAGDEEEAEGDT